MRIHLLRLLERLYLTFLPSVPPRLVRYNPATDLLWGLHRWALFSTSDVHTVGVVDLPRVLSADVTARLDAHGGTDEAFRVAGTELAKSESRIVSPEGETVFCLSAGNIGVRVVRRRETDMR